MSWLLVFQAANIKETKIIMSEVTLGILRALVTIHTFM